MATVELSNEYNFIVTKIFLVAKNHLVCSSKKKMAVILIQS